jgi:signal transduction histidine kinase
MELNKRVSLGLTAGLSVVFSVIVLRDIRRDWLIEGKALWSTVLENAIPLVAALAVGLAGYLVYKHRDEQFLETVTRWQYVGAIGLGMIALEVVGLQLVQDEIKPYLIIFQLAIGGAVAGTVVGYANARSNETQATVERERDKFEALFDNAPAESAEVVIEDGSPIIVASNSAFEERFGSGDSLAGESLFDVVNHDDQIQTKIRTHVTEGTEFETELHTPTASGQRDFQLRIVPFAAERAYLLYTDITDLKQTQAELKETVTRLEQSNERLQQFAYIASHDLQEPARMVSSYISLLDREYGDELDEEAKEYMDFATDGANRMQAMIDGLLDYSRVRTNAEAFSETDAEEVFEDTMQTLELLREEYDVTITHDVLPTVEADRNQLGQLFQNLIENAIEHGGEGTEIHVGADHRDGEVVFSVADDGPGIPESRQDRIFDIFEQGDRDNDGTGIGLAICDRIVSRHGGEMWIESTAGAGATFYFTIPA